MNIKILLKPILLKSMLFWIMIIINIYFCYSASSKFFKNDTFDSLCEGEIEGISITNKGELILSNDIHNKLSVPEAVIWDMVSDGNNIYIGTGHEGKVYKYVISNNSLNLIYDSDEMEVMALAIDSNNNLYMGTSPNGKIYKMSKNGEISVFSEIGEKNIYVMIFDKSGNLVVGTGENGRVFSVDKTGKYTIILDTSETNITSLKLAEDGSIFAGSYPNGILYKIKGESSFVIYDTEFDQISSIEIKGGWIYISGISIKELSSSIQPDIAPAKATSIEVTALQQESSIQQTELQKAQQQQMLLLTEKKLTRNSAIYKIDSDMKVEKIYTSGQSSVIKMGMNGRTELLFATSPDNSLWLMGEDKSYSMIFKGEGLVTSIMNERDNIWFSTSSPSYLYKLDVSYAKKGEYISKIYDTGGIAIWGRISWIADKMSAGTLVNCYTRSGNTSLPDNNWSNWSKAYVNSEGEIIESPKARFIQYKCELQTQDTKKTPKVRDVTISYLEQNQKPIITKIEVLSPGLVYEKFPFADETKPQIAKMQIEGLKTSPAMDSGMQLTKYKLGWLTIKWEAYDPNGDKLLFSLYYADISDMKWKILKKDIEDNFYSFDSTMLPNGKYKFKIEATDKAANPESIALATEKIVDKYYILDNAQPVIQIESIKNNPDEVIIYINVIDELSIIQEVEYAINIENWYKIFPVDNVLDSKNEKFELRLKNLNKGKQNIVIRAKDIVGNIATNNIDFEVK